ncbi:hypothetical protein CDAR_476281 [Caerostris darwini]|uniref:Uncharacterized protein n=1 Tax=Caerostris darwini TaxID=1538125 RepID=A0AAV4TPU4_9ARAC|nr:hypothetical protein CDAR_476281 [Caerostris darwini]
METLMPTNRPAKPTTSNKHRLCILILQKIQIPKSPFLNIRKCKILELPAYNSDYFPIECQKRSPKLDTCHAILMGDFSSLSGPASNLEDVSDPSKNSPGP